MLRLRRLLRGALSGHLGGDGAGQGRLRREGRRRCRGRDRRRLPDEHRRLPPPPRQQGAPPAPRRVVGLRVVGTAPDEFDMDTTAPSANPYASHEHHDFMGAAAAALADPGLQAALVRLTDTLMAGNRRGYAALADS